MSTSPTAPMLPSGASCHVCLLECADLWRRNQPVGDVEGIDVRRFNALHARTMTAEMARSVPVWQYTHSVVSRMECWTTLALPLAASPLQDGLIKREVTIECTRCGIVHAPAAEPPQPSLHATPSRSFADAPSLG